MPRHENRKVFLPRCSKRDCCRKSTSSCVSCNQRHCHLHHARNTDWGTHRVDEEEFHVPYHHWQFLVCWACGSRENVFETWDELVAKSKYLLRWIEDPELRKKAWQAYVRVNKIESSHLIRYQHARNIFGVEIEELEDCETHLFERHAFMPPIKI